MKRALPAIGVALGVFSVLACSPFESNGASAMDAGATDASGSPDAAPAAFCYGAIACDQFDGASASDWKPVADEKYVPHVDSGMLVCAMPTNPSDAKDSSDGCRLERTLSANVKMRIEFDLTFHAPSDYRGHNIQVFAIYSGTGDTRVYLGLYVQTPLADSASVVLTVAHQTDGPEIVGTGSIAYNIKTPIAIDVSFGSTGGSVLLDSVGASPTTAQPFTSSDLAPVLSLGVARQNGGTDALRAEYDNFRVTRIDSF
jgi:hypothetical protein